MVDHAQPRRPLVVMPATVVEPSRPQALEHWFDEMIDALLKAASALPNSPAPPAKG